MKKALITGITGQDGAYLAQFLLGKGYMVYGMRRRVSSDTTQRLHTLIEQYADRFFLVYGDMTDATSIFRLISAIQPDEIYNLAAQSDVAVSFEVPEYTAQADGVGVLHILEAVRTLKLEQKIKIYQASSSELFGKVQTIPQNEHTPFYPRSPYAVAKLYAYWIMVNYRQAYNMFACNGILFNHESPLRGENFVTRKIVHGIAQMLAGKCDTLFLGNLDARRDWGFAQDYVEAMWLMLQQEIADDFVIATGVSYSVREFVEHAFEHIGISLTWQGAGLAEKGIDSLTGKILVAVDEKFFRPTEVDYLLGDATKARTVLGWQPKTSFKELVQLMMDAEVCPHASFDRLRMSGAGRATRNEREERSGEECKL